MTKRRFTSLDFFRGLMLFVMGVDHVAGEASPLWQPLGFASAAEGFIFLSGVVVGLVYGRETLKEKGRLLARSLGRAWTLYKYHLIMLALVLPLAFGLPRVFGTAWREHMPLMLERPLAGLALSLTFLNQPRFFDILPLYTLFLLLTPLLLWGFARRRSALVLGLSFGVWLLAQFDLRHALISALPYYWNLQPGSFDPFGWQFLYVLGVFFGYRRLMGEPLAPTARWATLIALAVLLPLLVLRHLMRFDLPGFPYVQLELLTDRSSLGWLRLLNFLLLAYALMRLVSWRPQLFQLRWFVFLGQHSLQVFAAHVLLVYLVTPLQWRVLELGVWGALLALAFVVISLSVPAKAHALYLAKKRRRREEANARAESLTA